MYTIELEINQYFNMIKVLIHTEWYFSILIIEIHNNYIANTESNCRIPLA